LSSTVSATAANFIPVPILEPTVGTQLEIELTNACVVRLKGVIDPPLLLAAITAAGQLDGSREGANWIDKRGQEPIPTSVLTLSRSH